MSKAKPIDLGLKHVDELFMDDAERAELKLPRRDCVLMEWPSVSRLLQSTRGSASNISVV